MQQRTFDPWQQEAIEISGGRHLVLAPPGCGKTDILTERVVHAHRQGVAYGDMLCLTFTNRAAKGMAQRIADRTGNPVPDDLFVGNIHRYCSQMLFNEGIVHHNSAIIDEGDVENIVQEELRKRFDVQTHTTELIRLQHSLWQLTLGMRGDVVLHGDLLHNGQMTRLCDVLGRKHSDDDLAEIYRNINNLTGRYFALNELPAAKMMSLARAYQDYKEENDLLDYDDLLIMAYRHLNGESRTSNPESKNLPINSTAPNSQPSSPKRYSWIEIDEVQDLNALQLKLIDLLATDDATIVYLGDEQQAIFSFIGAKMETLEGLKQRCTGSTHYLHTNYRSPKYLLDLQNDYAVRNLHIRRELLPTTVNDTPHDDADLCLLNVGDAELESYYTARFAKRYGELDTAGRVAILVSTNREADEVSETMSALGIQHFKISGTDLFSMPTVRMLLAHLSVLADENVFIAWARLLWGLRVTPTYTAARDMMRDLRRVALLPSDFLMYPGSSYLQEFAKAYNDEELVIFDTETTGLDTRTDDIIQIAAIRVRQGKVVGAPLNIILETERELPATVGGKPNPMIEVYRKGPRMDRAKGLKMFMDYCHDKTLVGHNVEYDYQILANNLRREFGKSRPKATDAAAPELNNRYFDTLKYIRLVRPRLRHYRLEHLLDVLHLEGQNSHRADDDIMATLSLLTFCHTAALPLIAEQRHYLTDHAKAIEKFRSSYADIHLRARQSQYLDGTGIVGELKHTYAALVDAGMAEPLDKWRHLVHYLEADLIKDQIYPTLRTQLERYVTDLCTTKEADLCGGSLEEKYIISTVHKAKGLEFDTVLVYRAVDGSYPGSRSWTDKQIQEDARRLFVAISRSRKHLCVVYDSHYKSTPHALSPFLEKVKEHFTVYHRDSDGKIRC